MGCGSSKAAEGNQSKGDKTMTTAELKEADESQSIRSIKSTSKSWTNGMSSTTPETQIPGNIPEPVAFEIPSLNEEDSIVKKHPPKRLQRLEDQQILTQDQLIEKQQDVEERRQQVIEERIQSSRRSAHYRRQRITSQLTPAQEEDPAETNQNEELSEI